MHIKSKNLLTASVGIIALITMVTLDGCAAMRPAAAVDITGTWRAAIEVPEGNFEALMTISKSAAGAYTATLDVAVLGAYNIPLLFSFENNVVHYEVQGTGYSYDGKLVDPSTIEGSSINPDAPPSPLIFKRME